MERERLLEKKRVLESLVGRISGNKEKLGRVLGQLGKVNMDLGEEKEAMVAFIASQLLLTSLEVPERVIVEKWIESVRIHLGEERFMDCFYKALPLAGYLLAQHLGREEAELCMEEFVRRKRESE